MIDLHVMQMERKGGGESGVFFHIPVYIFLLSFYSDNFILKEEKSVGIYDLYLAYV